MLTTAPPGHSYLHAFRLAFLNLSILASLKERLADVGSVGGVVALAWSGARWWADGTPQVPAHARIGAEATMKINSSVRGTSLLALTVLGTTLLATFPTRVGGQEENLLPQSDPDVRALYAAQYALRTSGDNPLDPLKLGDQSSPDSEKLKLLNETATSGADYLRAIADLLAVYDNLQCETDRTIVKPLLGDRLRLNSRLLGLDAEKAAIPLGMANLPATTKRALKLRDDLVAAKNKLDGIAASLK